MSVSELRIDAKRAFVLADRMKRGPFEHIEVLLSVFASEKSRVQQLSEAELDGIIARNSDRLEKYDRAIWKFDHVALTQCTVYPRMGERAWAEGRVHEVAEKFKRLEPLTSRIWSMKLFASLFSIELPIVILSEGSILRIDDGSHRAVAMHLSGIQRAAAWIGTL